MDLPHRQHGGRQRAHAGQHGALAARIGAAVQAEREEIGRNRQPADRGDGQPAEPFVVEQQLERPGVVMQATQVEHHGSREEQAVDGLLAAHRPHAQREQPDRQEHRAGQVRQVLLQPAAQLVAPTQFAGGADPGGRQPRARAVQAADAQQQRRGRRAAGSQGQPHRPVEAAPLRAAARAIQQLAVAVDGQAADGLPARQIQHGVVDTAGVEVQPVPGQRRVAGLRIGHHAALQAGMGQRHALPVAGRAQRRHAIRRSGRCLVLQQELRGREMPRLGQHGRGQRQPQPGQQRPGPPRQAPALSHPGAGRARH